MKLDLLSEGVFLETKSYSQMEDQDLMQLLVAENLGAWSELVKRYGNLVYTIAYQVLNNTNDSEDAVQNSFMRLKLYSSKFDPSLPLKPWLSKIASGEAIRIYNKKKNINKKESSRMEPQNFAIPSHKQDVSDVAAQKEIEVMVKKAIELLPEISRVAITLYYIGGMTQSEIAKELGLSQFSISEKIKLGLEKVKMHLKNAGVHASIVISPTLLQDSLTLNSLPQELGVKLAKSFPQEVTVVDASLKLKSGLTQLKIKGFAFWLIGGLSVFFIGYALVKNNPQNKGVTSIQTTESAKINNDKPQQIFKENVFYPLEFDSYIPVTTKFVKFKNADEIEALEGDAQVIGTIKDKKKIIQGDGNWIVNSNKTGELSLNRIIASDTQMDGLYFNQDFYQPHIFKGTIKINSDKCKVFFIMSTPMHESKFEQIDAKSNDEMVYARRTSNMTTLEAHNTNLIDFKIYIWYSEGKILSASFITCKGFPKAMVAKMLPMISDDYKFGILSNGKLELTKLEFCPLSKDWDYHSSQDINEKINEFPVGFFNGKVVKPKESKLNQNSSK